MHNVSLGTKSLMVEGGMFGLCGGLMLFTDLGGYKWEGNLVGHWVWF